MVISVFLWGTLTEPPDAVTRRHYAPSMGRIAKDKSMYLTNSCNGAIGLLVSPDGMFARLKMSRQAALYRHQHHAIPLKV